MMNTLDLFSGIGGFALGLERTGGFRTVAFCEIEPYPRAVLAKHWPEVPCYDDVRTLTAERLAADGVSVDVICGGFPCQDISFAGTGAGLSGARSGLWWEFHRLISKIRPAWVVAENVSALRSRGLDEVLGSLAALGYDAEWHCIPAGAVGAPHRRDRIWIIAHPMRSGSHVSAQPSVHLGEAAAGSRDGEPERLCSPPASWALAHADSTGLAVGESVPGDDGPKLTAVVRDGWWTSEPNVGRMAHGVPARVDRLRCLGNAVVPQVVEIIGRSILAVEAQLAGAA